MQAQIDALERLATLDAALLELGQELAEQRTALTGKKQNLAELDDKLSRAKSGITEMERTRGDLVGEMRQMNVQIDKSREKLSRCRTEREANAVQRELEELRKLYRDRELESEKLTGLLDQARAELTVMQAERDRIAGDLGESEGAVSTRLGEVEQELAIQQEARTLVVAEVTPVLYRRYELIRKRKGSALAHTREGTCSACHMRLPPQLFQQLMRGSEFGQCPSCNRILYFRTDGDGAESQAPAETADSSA
jgi:uncharacterized protein